MQLRILFFLLMAILSTSITAQSLIPQPMSMTAQQGRLNLKYAPAVFTDASFDQPAHVMAYAAKIFQGGNARKVKSAGLTMLKLPKVAGYHPEFYRLQITSRRISIQAYTDTGLFRALTTLRQLLPPDHLQKPAYPLSLPCMLIEDRPSFTYRGLHLDVCRHFFGVDFIKSYLDAMAEHKLNVFHWHLTEDQGWRIEIKKYPELTRVGAWRQGSQKGRYREQRFDTLRYGGFYSQDEIREVVAYAAARYITVIPEIEMPGHSLAALASYPRLGCTGGPYSVARGWGVFDDVYCAGNDSTLLFLQDVLTEVLELFPSTFIHIGGDECPKTRWKACARCQTRMAAHSLKDEHELQSWFVQQMENWLSRRGRRLIGWDEILEGGLAPGATVMSWRGTAGGEEAARMGHDVIMTPGKPCYFDHYQGPDSTEPIAIGGYNPLRSVYDYQPVPPSLDSQQRKFVLGAQGNVWTEYMETEDHVEYMVWPRAAALSETLWTGPGKDYSDFLQRLQADVKRLEAMGVNYAPHFRTKP